MKSYVHIRQTLQARVRRLRPEEQSGMTTAEYAVGTLAACWQHTSRSTGKVRNFGTVARALTEVQRPHAGVLDRMGHQPPTSSVVGDRAFRPLMRAAGWCCR